MQRIYVFFGMIASGKSTLAEEFADRLDLPYYNTDRVRKELAGLVPTDKMTAGMNQGIYTEEFTRKTYGEMLERAENDLRKGKAGVVLDGSYHRRLERDEVREMGSEIGAGCVFVQCICGDEEVKRRLDLRSRDPEAVSDGRWEIYQAQKQRFIQPEELSSSELIVLDTEDDIDVLLDKIEQALAALDN